MRETLCVVLGSSTSGPAADVLAQLPLVDHHCHGVVQRDLDRPAFEALLTEAAWPGQPDAELGRLAATVADTGIGQAVRRWCAPVLDLPPHALLDDYLARRTALGHAEVSRRLLRGSGCADLLVDTGYEPEPLTTPAALGALAGARAHEVVRLERVAEDVAATGPDAAGFADAVLAELHRRTGTAVGTKSVAAYRSGLDLDPARPSAAEVARAAGAWLRDLARGGAAGGSAAPRCADPVLERFLLWAAVDRGLPLQLHTGLGDADADLRLGDPLLLTPLLRATADRATPVMLLHAYPFQRHAGYLALVFPHVFVDVGLALHGVGPQRAPAVLAELVELAPYGKVLHSSDGFGLPELHLLGTLGFRRSLAAVLDAAVRADEASAADAARLAAAVGAGTARRVYALPPDG